MINWVAVLRRMLKLYNVKTQGELGMALGVPLNFTLDGTGADSVIPWPILELVVSEKRIGWDWLLTGRGERDVSRAAEDEPDAAAARRAAEHAADAHASVAPRFETRDLARVLLNPSEPSAPAPAPDPGAPSAPPPSSVKSRMQKEIDRVESLLADRH